MSFNLPLHKENELCNSFGEAPGSSFRISSNDIVLHRLDPVHSKQQIGYRNEGWISREKKRGCFREIATFCEQSRLPFVALTDLAFLLFSLLHVETKTECCLPTGLQALAFRFAANIDYFYLFFFLASYPSLSLLNDSSPQPLSCTNSRKLVES